MLSVVSKGREVWEHLEDEQGKEIFYIACCDEREEVWEHLDEQMSRGRKYT
jgi:hypothetical protein